MARLGNFVENVDPNVIKVDKDDILDKPFCFEKAYHRDTDDGKYWKVYGTFFNDITSDVEKVFFIVPSSESRDKLLTAMNAVAPLHFCSLNKQTFIPNGGKIEQTFYAFVALDCGTCPCMYTGLEGSEHHFEDFLAEYKGITKEEIEARAEYVKVEKKDIYNLDLCIEKLMLKPARDADSRPYWAVYVQTNGTVTREDGTSTNKMMFFLPSSPSRDTLFKVLQEDVPVHCSKLTEKSFTPKGQKEARVFYALEDTKSSACSCGCDMSNDNVF